MNEQESHQATTLSANNLPANKDFAGGKAALTEASKYGEQLYVSLAGVAAIVNVLLAGLALPVFGFKTIVSLYVFSVMVVASLVGVFALCFINIRAHLNTVTQARLTEVLLNSLGQGFLNFNAKGVCAPVYSQACVDLLEVIPTGKNIADVLRLGDDQKSDFKDWMDMLFTPNHALSFDDVVKFLPQTFQHASGGRVISLTYRPVEDNDKRLLSVVVIATDMTEEAEALLRARVQQNYVNMICRIFKERNQFMITITHLRRFVSEARAPVKQDEASTILRMLHTLKAAGKHFYLDALNDVIARLEVELRSPSIASDKAFQDRLKRGADEVEGCIKAVLEQVGNLIGQDFEGRVNMHEVDEEQLYKFATYMREQKVAPEIVREYLSAIAAVPINDSFGQFERELKDLCEIMGKKVKPIRYTGTNPRVLIRPLEGFLLAVMHICRNIVDHGIEPAVTRLARGKDPAGQVTIHTELLDGVPGKHMLLISIGDDGNGVDPAQVRAKLAKIDPNGAWQSDNDDAVIQRILQWEVSTKTHITDLSGHGVGMEAVDREVRILGGNVRVFSELYKGTRFDIHIPYNLDSLTGKNG